MNTPSQALLDVKIINNATNSQVAAYLKPMDVATSAIKLILQTSLDHPTTIILLGLFNRAGKLKSSMQALVYILDNVCLQFTRDYCSKLATLILFMGEEKENPSGILEWDDIYYTLVNDFKDACVVSLELEMMDFITNPSTKNTYEKLHREYLRLLDAFECVFGSFDLKGALHVYISKRLSQLETENKYQIFKPFNTTLTKMIIGKDPNIVYAVPENDKNRDESIKLFHSMRNLIFLITNTITFEKHIDHFIKDVNTHLSGNDPITREANIKSILLHLETYGYDLRYPIRLMNRIRRAGFKDGKGYNKEVGEVVKKWLTRIFFQYLQNISSDHIDHGTAQAELYIKKYVEIWGTQLPFQEVGEQLNKLQIMLKLQNKYANEICAGTKHPSFGGILNTPSTGIVQRTRNNKLRKDAAEFFSAYTAHYMYSWNAEPFQYCYNQLHSVQRAGDHNNHYNDYLKDLAKGVTSIDHVMMKKNTWYQIKLNSQMAKIVQKIMPVGMPLIKNDPELSMFKLSIDIFSE
jgi:hypothetical protein